MVLFKKNSNIPAENLVLSGLCQLGKDTYIDISPYLLKDTFVDESNQIVFRCIESLFENSNNIDLPSILVCAKKLGISNLIEKNYDRIKDFFSSQITQESVENAAKTLNKLHIARDVQQRLFKSYNDLQEITGDESIDKIISLYEQPLFDMSLSLNMEMSNKPELIGNNIQEYIKHLETQKGKQVGLDTGYKWFDKSIGGGLRRKTVSLVGARTGCGKSLMGDNIAVNICDRRTPIPILMLDTEMSYEDHANRMLAFLSGVSIDDIETGYFNTKNLLKQYVDESVNKLSKFPYYYISVAGRSFDEILSIMRRWVLKEIGFEAGRTRDCLIIYDYLKLMDSSKISSSMNEHQALGFLTSHLHDFTVKYDVPVLSFVQLNRDGISDESTAAISQSDRIGWLCTTFSIFKKKSDEEIIIDGQENGNRKLIVIKGRHAPDFDNNNYINYTINKNTARITEGKTRSEIHKKSD